MISTAYDDPQISKDFSAPLISSYWASDNLNYPFYENPIDSQVATYDKDRANIEAVMQARGIIEGDRKQSTGVYNVSLPAVLTAAILESSNIEDILRNVIRMRNEAQAFRNKMRQLDVPISFLDMRDAISDLEQEGRLLGNAYRVAKIGAEFASYFDQKFIIVSGLLDAAELVNQQYSHKNKKNFVKRLKRTTPTVKGFASKISEIFRNSGYQVNGNEVIMCINTFTEKP